MARGLWAWVFGLLQVFAGLTLMTAEAAAAPLNDASFQALLARNPAPGRPIDSVTELVPLLPRELATRAGADRSDWSMALEPRSLAFYDGILSGMHGGKSYYLKEDRIFEILDQLSLRDASLQPYFSLRRVYAQYGYPFGDRIDLGWALKSCPLLTAPTNPKLAGAGH